MDITHITIEAVLDNAKIVQITKSDIEPTPQVLLYDEHAMLKHTILVEGIEEDRHEFSAAISGMGGTNEEIVQVENLLRLLNTI
jgi:hypothetical protein